MTQKLTRRQVLKLTGGLVGVSAVASMGLLSGCAPKPAPAAPTTAPTVAPAKSEGEAAPTTAPAASDSGCQMDWNPTFPPAPKKYDPPVEISTLWDAGRQWQGTDNWDNNPLYNECLENTHVKFTVHWESAGDVRQAKLAADFAAGTPPDMYCSGGTFLEQLIQDGAIEDIKSVWDATASPLLKEKKEYPARSWWRPVDRDGKLFGIPFSWGPAYNVDNLCYIRKDMLDKVGMEMPTTLDGWAELMKKWKDEGITKWGLAASKNLVTWHYSLDPIIGAFGIMPTCWRDYGDGTLVYDSVSPDVKKALGLLRDWYAQGFLNPDFYTLGEGQDEPNVLNNNHGIYASPWWVGGGHADWETKDYADIGMEWTFMPYPKGPDGKQGRKESGRVQDSIWFKKGIDPVKPEAFINNMNWHMEKHVNWEKYQQYGEWRNSHAFVEGYEYIWNDQCELEEGPEKNTYIYMNAIDGGFPYGVYPAYQYDVFNDMKKWLEADPATLNKAQAWLVSKPEVLKEQAYYPAVFETLDIAINSEYYGNPTQLITETWPNLGTLESTVFTEIIIGDRNLDDFDSFVDEWKSTGGEAVTKEVNELYKKTQGK